MVNVPSRLSVIPTTEFCWLQVPTEWTTCWRLSLLARKLPSPVYCAATVLVPVGNEVVLAAAAPLTRAFVLKGEPPARKTTSPVGAPAPGATMLRVAVKVTFELCCDGFAEETKAVVVPAAEMLAVVAG